MKRATADTSRLTDEHDLIMSDRGLAALAAIRLRDLLSPDATTWREFDLTIIIRDLLAYHERAHALDLLALVFQAPPLDFLREMHGIHAHAEALATRRPAPAFTPAYAFTAGAEA